MAPRPSASRLTHFLCIPLVTSTSRPQLQKTLSIFKDDAANCATSGRRFPSGIPPQAFRPLGTLNLSVGVMSLLSPERQEGALKILRQLNPTELLSSIKPADTRSDAESPGEKSQDTGQDPASLNITLKGLRSMQETSKTPALFAPSLDPDMRLYRFCQKLREVFGDFLVQDTRPLRLHAPILNTLYVPGKKTTKKRARKERLKLDATELIARYENFVWMEGVRVEKVAICKVGAQVRKGGQEEHEVVGEVELL
ncbi:unnamed protein product [Diplocarpon coronariae]|uniref:A-kinase anchor protein 7-like phosphoesterase domain-containing protein n=1 Tax=Diplocarpon coronariae TaxID=2795749 RepID=A0A218Z0E1_9HELO|nr:hypothetical protein B2J93_4802 [Marssonina coronariae]